MASRGLALVAAAALSAAGCAYYNVLYNANQKYDEAQLLKIQAELTDPDRTKIGSSEERLYTEAFEKAARVPRFYPDSKWVDDSLLLMGLVSIEKGDYSTAIRKFDEILTLFPDSNLTAKALLAKGRAYIETKQYAEAVADLEKARTMGDDDLEDDIIYFLGLVEERQGNIEDAKKAYVTVLEKHGDSEWLAEAGLALGRIQTEEKQLGEAAKSFERVRKKGKTSEERFGGGLAKGEALLANGEYERAQTTFHDLSKRATNEKQRGEALLLEAKALAAEGNTGGAMDLYHSILDKMPRTEAAAKAQFAIAKTYDDAGELVRAKDEYQLVNEQGTGFDAWRDASTRITEIQTVLDLRQGIANEDEKPEERYKKRFLLAEQLLEKIGDVHGALAEYSSLSQDAAGTDLGARALYAEAWVLEHRLSQPDTAEVLLMELSRDYRTTEVGVAARNRLGMPVWAMKEIETPPVRYVQSDSTKSKGDEIVLERIEPRAATLPEGVTEVQVWVRVSIGLDGEVTKATIAKSGGEDVDAAALEAAKASKFRSPADGGPAITVVQYDFPPKPKAAPAPDAAGQAGALPERHHRPEQRGLRGKRRDRRRLPIRRSRERKPTRSPPRPIRPRRRDAELRGSRLPSGAVVPKPEVGDNPEDEPPPEPPQGGEFDPTEGD